MVCMVSSRSKQGLEEWRTQAKLKQKEQEQMVQDSGQQHYHKAVDTAPFATDTKEKSVSLAGTGTDDGDSRGAQKGGDNRWRVHRYRVHLEEKRKQAGIISNPSVQLQEAEKALAEVRCALNCELACGVRFIVGIVQALAMQEELEKKKVKEYRLRAFTGDD